MDTAKTIQSIFDEVYAYLRAQGSYRELFNGNFSKGLLPEVTRKKVAEANEFASAIRSRIKAVYEQSEQIGHYDDMFLKTVLFYCDANFCIGGCENPVFSESIDLNWAVAPNNSPLYFMNSIKDIDTRASVENSRRYLDLLAAYPALARGCLERTEHQLRNHVFMPRLTLDYAIRALEAFVVPAAENCLFVTVEDLHEDFPGKEAAVKEANQNPNHPV